MSLLPNAHPVIAKMDEGQRTTLQARLREILPPPDAAGRWSYAARANAIAGRVPAG
jgi:hypothetical protein